MSNARLIAQVERSAHVALALLERIQGASDVAYWTREGRPDEVATAYAQRLAPAIAGLANALTPEAQPSDPISLALARHNGPDWQGRGHTIGNACRKARDAYYHYQAYARTHDRAGGWVTSGNYRVDAVEGFEAPKLPGWRHGERAVIIINSLLLALDTSPSPAEKKV